MRTRLAPLLLAGQGVYYLLSGLWPLLHMPSFLVVTGNKTDLWLVQTVGALIVVLGVVYLLAARREAVTAEVVTLSVGAAVALALIDVVFVSLGLISPVYLLDAVVEGAILLGWGLVAASWMGERGRARRNAPGV
ncbi:MAG TPA: hypothetical protein VNZ52_14000 [Candidatus Thermoplasmatota archaeon]|nr:hypothetical protein [Candidatus Thermoplasmatota archaeon]